MRWQLPQLLHLQPLSLSISTSIFTSCCSSRIPLLSKASPPLPPNPFSILLQEFSPFSALSGTYWSSFLMDFIVSAYQQAQILPIFNKASCDKLYLVIPFNSVSGKTPILMPPLPLSPPYLPFPSE